MASKEALVYLHRKKPRQTKCDQLNEHQEDIRIWLLSGLSLAETLEALKETHRVEVKKSLLHYYVQQNLPELLEGRKRGRPRVNKKTISKKKKISINKKKVINKKEDNTPKKIVRKKILKKKKVITKTKEIKKKVANKKRIEKKDKAKDDSQSFFNF